MHFLNFLVTNCWLGIGKPIRHDELNLKMRLNKGIVVKKVSMTLQLRSECKIDSNAEDRLV